MSKLRECPTCGSKAEIRYSKTSHQYKVRCIGSCQYEWFPEKIDAIANWNIRHNDWISTKERLPETDAQVVICYARSTYTYNAYLSQGSKKWFIFNYGGGYVQVDNRDLPTHWKPIILPEAE